MSFGRVFAYVALVGVCTTMIAATHAHIDYRWDYWTVREWRSLVQTIGFAVIFGAVPLIVVTALVTFLVWYPLALATQKSRHLQNVGVVFLALTASLVGFLIIHSFAWRLEVSDLEELGAPDVPDFFSFSYVWQYSALPLIAFSVLFCWLVLLKYRPVKHSEEGT